MIEKKRRCAAFAVCGSFCTLEAALDAARALRVGASACDELCGRAGHPLWPGLRLASSAGRADGPSGSGYPAGGGASRPTASGRRPRDRALHRGHAGPAGRGPFRHAGDAGGEESAPGCPVVIAVSTNDGLGASGENIARLYQRKHYYFVPYGQDDPNTKPQSLKARFELLPQTLEAALEGRQLQPVLQCPCG